MKILLIFIALITTITVECSIFLGGASKENIYLNQILNQATTIIKQKHDLYPCGTIIAMPDGVVKELGLCFTTHEKLSEEQLRSLVIDCATELLNQINNNPNIQPFLVKRPFTIKETQIIIYNENKDRRIEIYYPDTSSIQILKGILSIRKQSPESKKIEYFLEETYEEAMEKLNKKTSH